MGKIPSRQWSEVSHYYGLSYRSPCAGIRRCFPDARPRVLRYIFFGASTVRKRISSTIPPLVMGRFQKATFPDELSITSAQTWKSLRSLDLNLYPPSLNSPKEHHAKPPLDGPPYIRSCQSGCAACGPICGPAARALQFSSRISRGRRLSGDRSSRWSLPTQSIPLEPA